jgi:hypothetical protein
MKSLVVSLLVLFAAGAASAQLVVTPAKRAEVLAQVEGLMAPRDAASTPTPPTPFHSESFRAAILSAGVAGSAAPATRSETARPAGPRVGRDLIVALAEGLRPSGFFIVSGEPTLVFGQKRAKAGDSLSINFEGADHTVVITAITPPNFTFRLGNEEFTRTIR